MNLHPSRSSLPIWQTSRWETYRPQAVQIDTSAVKHTGGAPGFVDPMVRVIIALVAFELR